MTGCRWKTDLLAVQQLGLMPFHVGVFDRPHNPAGIPNVHPFTFGIRKKDGLLVQVGDERTSRYLKCAYAMGHLLGTAMDDTELGRRYAEDFHDFIRARVPSLLGLRVLEIGCGRGYLLRLMAEAGADVLGIEPGVGLREHWRRNAVDVVGDVFPSSQVEGHFDLIVAYGVLEHIEQPDDFVAAVGAQLAPGGQAILSVPNCDTFLKHGDPAMFVHEHFSYFGLESLRAFLDTNDLEVLSLREAGFGGAIYCAWQPRLDMTKLDSLVRCATEATATDRFSAWRDFISTEVWRSSDEGRSLGIFCPGRALSVLPVAAACRFFDDDREVHGCYYPPFIAPVESRSNLIERPVDELWIYSRTFGPRLAAALREVPSLQKTEILTVDDLTQRFRSRGQNPSA